MNRNLLTGTAAVLLLAVSSPADEVSQVTLPNGAAVSLKDDFTWEYVIQDEGSPDLTAQVMKQTELLGSTELLDSTAKEGIKVDYIQSRWDDSRLGLDFELESRTDKNAVLVDVEASFYDDGGSLIKKQTLTLWQATHRMPETYLRQGQRRASRTQWVEGIPSEKWKKGLLSLKITKIKFR
jgi:hypothetical protein